MIFRGDIDGHTSKICCYMSVGYDVDDDDDDADIVGSGSCRVCIFLNDV